MVTHMLQALSESAKAFKGAYGSDIPVDLHTKLGRKVSGPNSVNLPQSWGQVSQTHCTIFSEDQGVSAAQLSEVGKYQYAGMRAVFYQPAHEPLITFFPESTLTSHQSVPFCSTCSQGALVWLACGQGVHAGSQKVVCSTMQACPHCMPVSRQQCLGVLVPFTCASDCSVNPHARESRSA